MQVYGQTKDDVFIQVITAKDKATLNLGVCLVVDNLGVNILIGQPAKIRHKIVTKPHLSLISFSDLEGKNYSCSSSQEKEKKHPAEILRIKESISLYPGEVLHLNLSLQFEDAKRVMKSPRYTAQQLGFEPFIARVSKERQVNITNTSENIWTLKKYLHLADVRKVISSDEATISKLFTQNISDFQPVKERDHKLNNFTGDVVIDPDKLMEDSWKCSFKSLCDDYTDIIQYTPGIYNGRFGFIQNTVEYTNIPLPNSKCYVPKYNKEQMDLLADKMDELLELGVLAKPEDVGVTP